MGYYCADPAIWSLVFAVLGGYVGFRLGQWRLRKKACTISGYVQGLADGIEFKPGVTIAAHPATAPGTSATK